MATFFQQSLFVLLLLHAHQVVSSTPDHHGLIRTLNFSLFQQQVPNKTAFIVLTGVTGVGVSLTTAPFGTIYLANDRLTAESNASSETLGTVQVAFLTSSMDGLQTMLFANFILKTKDREGSISVFGGVKNTEPSPVQVLGGTGDFMHVQGYATCLPVVQVDAGVVFPYEFFLSWPPIRKR
uniref:Dirigent protein n=1 Tax=Kadsura heteroclita TaxID=124781 RepID=A0A7U3VI99_9MAGN|nr:dirigent protein 3 [Kadsura heteroclita]